MSRPRPVPGPVTGATALTLLAALVAAARTIATALLVDDSVVGTLVGLVVVALLVASAVSFRHHRGWARLAVMVWSLISGVASVSTLVFAVEPWWYLLSAAVTLACAGALLALLTRPSAREWFDLD